jgi:hypothetical protein
VDFGLWISDCSRSQALPGNELFSRLCRADLLSIGRSLRDSTACITPRNVSGKGKLRAGRACKTVRSQAEPGNKNNLELGSTDCGFQIEIHNPNSDVAQLEGGTGLRSRDVWVRVPPSLLNGLTYTYCRRAGARLGLISLIAGFNSQVCNSRAGWCLAGSHKPGSSVRFRGPQLDGRVRESE